MLHPQLRRPSAPPRYIHVTGIVFPRRLYRPRADAPKRSGHAHGGVHARPIRAEGAFKRTRDRQPKVVLQRAGPASSLSFSYCFCERRRARGRIINAIFSSRSLPVRSWKTQFCGRGQWRSNVRTKTEFLHYLAFPLSLSRCQLRCLPAAA